MQNVLVEVEGDVEDVVAIILDAYTLRAVPLLYSAAPVGRDVSPYRLGWQMLTGLRRPFIHEV